MWLIVNEKMPIPYISFTTYVSNWNILMKCGYPGWHMSIHVASNIKASLPTSLSQLSKRRRPIIIQVSH